VNQIGYHLNRLETYAKAVLVTVSGNDAPKKPIISWHPARFADPSSQFGQLANLMVVGCTDFWSHQGRVSQFAPWMTTFAPGSNAWVAVDPTKGRTDAYAALTGTSFGEFGPCTLIENEDNQLTISISAQQPRRRLPVSPPTSAPCPRNGKHSLRSRET
jgi:hypothetical protein